MVIFNVTYIIIRRIWLIFNVIYIIIRRIWLYLMFIHIIIRRIWLYLMLQLKLWCKHLSILFAGVCFSKSSRWKKKTTMREQFKLCLAFCSHYGWLLRDVAKFDRRQRKQVSVIDPLFETYIFLLYKIECFVHVFATNKIENQCVIIHVWLFMCDYSW